MIPSSIPSPIKLVESLIDFAALLVVAVDDDEGAVELDVDVEVDDDEEVERVVVVGTGK